MATLSADIFLYDENTTMPLGHAAVGLRMVGGRGYLPAGRVDVDILQSGRLYYAKIKVASLDAEWPIPLSPMTKGQKVTTRDGSFRLDFGGPVLHIVNEIELVAPAQLSIQWETKER